MNQNHLKVLSVAVVIIGLQLLIVTNPLAGQSTDAAVAINSATKAAIRDAVNDIISGTIEGITVRMAGVMAQTSRPSQADIQAEERAAAQRAYEEAQQRDWVTKIFAIRNGEPSQIARALSLFRANIAVEDTLRTISVRAPKEIMPAIEEAITKLDVAVRKTVDLTVYVLVASSRNDGGGKPLPQSLQPVAAELKKVLSYTDFYLADTLVIQGADGRYTELRGTVQLPNATGSSDFNFNANVRIDSSDPKAPVLDLRDMQFVVDALVPSGQNPGYRGVRLSIRTSVQVPSGQQVVVGKATFGDSALILVMNARFSG